MKFKSLTLCFETLILDVFSMNFECFVFFFGWTFRMSTPPLASVSTTVTTAAGAPVAARRAAGRLPGETGKAGPEP